MAVVFCVGLVDLLFSFAMPQLVMYSAGFGDGCGGGSSVGGGSGGAGCGGAGCGGVGVCAVGVDVGLAAVAGSVSVAAACSWCLRLLPLGWGSGFPPVPWLKSDRRPLTSIFEDLRLRIKNTLTFSITIVPDRWVLSYVNNHKFLGPAAWNQCVILISVVN